MRAIHPLFGVCSTLILDPFWVEVLDNCSRGRFPRGVKFDSTSSSLSLNSGKKNGTESFSLPTEPRNALPVLLSIFRDKLHLRSSRDLQISRQEMDELRSKATEGVGDDWRKIRNRSMKSFLLVEYIKKLREQHSLSSKASTRLLSQLHLAFALKSLTPDDVHMSSGRIDHIDGFEIGKGGRFEGRKIPPVKIPRTKERTETLFTTALEKFIRDYTKRKTRINLVEFRKKTES